MNVVKHIFLLGILTFYASCTTHKEVEITSSDYHLALDKLTEVIVYDIFSPPVASRIYVYPSIAAYEIARQDTTYALSSLSDQIEHFSAIPKPASSDKVDLKMAAIMAYLNVSEELIFSSQKIKIFKDSLYQHWKSSVKFKASLAYAQQVSEHTLAWAKQDQYAQTRTMPKFSINTEDPMRWLPTPPDYMDGIEPNWHQMRTFVLDSSSIFKPNRPTPFSLEKDSQFYKELLMVYDAVNSIREEGDASEKLQIAQFWDCNPYVSTHKGHVMFATKKITPGAHWILINKIIAEKEQLSFVETAKSHALVSIGVYEAFISSWDEKYRSNLIRPESLIHRYIDEEWKPILQTPPFPEHTSGHSVVSGAASVIMTSLYGEDYYFEDTTEIAFGLPSRSFSSFDAAAEEAAISRLYGGIHFMPAISEGLLQGRKVGKYVLQKINLEDSKTDL